MAIKSSQASAHIDLDAIEDNFNYVKQLAPNSKVMAVVKGDAYGHGGVRVAKRLIAADMFGVARVSEAVELREAGVGQPICLMEGIYNKEELNLASIYELQVVVHDDYQLDLLERHSARRGVWLKIDTGMGRIGIRPEYVERALGKLGHQTLLGVITHLADSGNLDSSKTQDQIKVFQGLLDGFSHHYPAFRHASVANSGGVMNFPQSHQEMVRPGIMLYGATPMDDQAPIDALHPAMTFGAPIIAIREVKQGESVGYGGIWTADSDTRVAVVAVGYADGYPRETKPGTPVLINGERRELVGRVSMDMISVRIEESDRVDVGDRAVLWGEGLPVEEIAQSSGTIAYTLLTGVSARVPRIHREGRPQGRRGIGG